MCGRFAFGSVAVISYVEKHSGGSPKLECRASTSEKLSSVGAFISGSASSAFDTAGGSTDAIVTGKD